MRALITVAAAVCALAFALPASAETLEDDRAAARPPVGKSKVRKKRKRAVFSGYQVPDSKLRSDPLDHPSGHLHIYSVNSREDVEVDLYGNDGDFSPAALDQLNHLWRCKRTNTEKPINPHLFEILSLLQDHFGGRTIELVSGFRNQRHTSSYHFHGSASDIRIIGLSDKALHNFVATLDTGGMGLGLYPRSGFIHIDVRPEPSYRWVDYTPGGSGEGASRKAARRAKKAAPNT
jgi:uncharacterized protein YcbK (DUF882 family)